MEIKLKEMKVLINLKTIFLITLITASLLLLIGCGDDDEPIVNPDAPTAPVLTSPEDAAEDVVMLPTFSWQASVAESGVKEYSLYLDKNTDPTTILSTGSGTSFSLVTALEPETTYYWKVQVTDEMDRIATSSVFSFTTIGEDTSFELKDVEFGKALAALEYANLVDEKYILNLEAVASVTSLDLGGSSSTPIDIRDIDGIQFFSALKVLDVDYTSITKLDLLNNTNLDSLQYTNSADNTANFLTELLLPSGMTRIRIFRHNLGDFDATGFAELTYLRLDGNDIANAEAAGVTNVLSTLTISETSNTQLVHLDMGGNLDADGNAITYEVSQALYDQLTDAGANNKEGVSPPATFSVSSIMPADGAVDIPINANVEVTFSSELDMASFVYTWNDAANVSVASSVTVDGAVATINPGADLANNTAYTLSITAATGSNGADITETYTTNFTTISGDDIVVTAVDPADNAINVALGAFIDVEFSSEIELSTVVYTLTAGENSVASVASVNGTTLTITPDNSLAVSTGYTLNITAAESTSGGTLTDSFTSGFTTVNALLLQGVMSFQNDGTAADGRNRAIHLRANADIADLSVYGIGIPNNGGGTDGKELSLPTMSVMAGQDILFIRGEDEASMTTYFGSCFNAFDITLTDAEAGGSINFNGDDAVELYENDTVIEVYGDVELDGTGESWEYTGSWGYRQLNGTFLTGALDCTLNATDNASSSCPYPFCSE